MRQRGDEIRRVRLRADITSLVEPPARGLIQVCPERTIMAPTYICVKTRKYRNVGWLQGS